MKSRHTPAEEVYGSDSKKDCLRQALVLEAVGIDCETLGQAGKFVVIVAVTDAMQARAELDAYDREDHDWPADATSLPPRAGGWAGVSCYAAVLVLVAVFEHQDMFSFDWFAAGKTHAGLIQHGQWWRAVTALSLHADPRHLFANIATGGLIGLFVGQLLGSGLAWAGILTGGVAGNILNAWIRQPDHTSVGASTAVFAALGIQAAYVWMQRRSLRVSKLARWAPLVSASVLLAWLGTGGVRTDVAAHVTGFLSGTAVGALLGRLGDRVVLTTAAQFLLGMGTLLVLALAWALALA
jgi:rhomboid protease GluP